MKIIVVFFFLFINSYSQAQELFVWSEPGSNMAAKAIGFRATNIFMKAERPARHRYYLVPEIMVGITGKLMLHVEAFFNNTDNFTLNGGALYLKYRFYSMDEIHSHFRMAIYSKAALNNSRIQEPTIDLNRYNSGFEAGLVATKLMNKVALSAGLGFLHATNNINNKVYYADKNMNAIAYNFSMGKLMLPAIYTSYKQINLNLLLEVPGQTNFSNGKSYLDLAAALQFIILSRMRIDVGYRLALIKDLLREETKGFLLRLEYNIFNAYK